MVVLVCSLLYLTCYIRQIYGSPNVTGHRFKNRTGAPLSPIHSRLAIKKLKEKRENEGNTKKKERPIREWEREPNSEK